MTFYDNVRYVRIVTRGNKIIMTIFSNERTWPTSGYKQLDTVTINGIITGGKQLNIKAASKLQLGPINPPKSFEIHPFHIGYTDDRPPLKVITHDMESLEDSWAEILVG